MSVRTKILAVVLIVATLGALLGVTGFVAVRIVHNETSDLGVYSRQSDNFTSILSAHYTWRNGLTEAVLTGSAFTGSLDPTTCALGKWMSSDEAKEIDDEAIAALLTKVNGPHTYIHNEAEKVVAFMEAGDRDAAMGELISNILPSFDEVIVSLLAIKDRYSELVNEKEEEVAVIETIATTIIVILIAVAFAVSIILALFISGRIGRLLIPMTAFFQRAGATGDIEITDVDKEVIGKYIGTKDELGRLTSGAVAFIERISEVSDVMHKVAGGDLTAELTLLSDRDVMGKSINQMTDNLNEMFGEIDSSASLVSVGSRQIADGAQSLAQGSTQQAATIEQLSGSIADVTDKTKHNTEMTDKAAALAGTIKGNAEKGSQHIDEMISAVNEINEASHNISRVIKVIDDIAFQTNILALNAAVEAARAGAHGKGFAVVAEEVRTLASKCSEAAKETEGLIKDSMAKAEMGSQIAEKTAENFTEIVSGVKESSELISEIAKSSVEQSTALSHISTGIDHVVHVIQQNSATAEQSAAASEEMSGQSDVLEQLLGRFHIKAGNAGNYIHGTQYALTNDTIALPEQSGHKIA